MAHRNAKPSRAISPARKKARADLARALLKVIRDRELSQEGAARLIGVAKSTIGRWVRLDVEMNIEAVVASPGIGDAFKRALCTHDHDDSVPYVARKKASR